MNPSKKKLIVCFGMLGVLVCLEGSALALAGVTIYFDRPVHFLTPGGEDVVVQAGDYALEQAEEWLRLISGERQDAVLIQAEATTHVEKITGPVALSVAGDEADRHHVLLLLPDGHGLESIGTYSGIQSRGFRALLSRVQQQKALTTQQVKRSPATTKTPIPQGLTALLTPSPKGTPLAPSLISPNAGHALTTPPTNSPHPGPKMEFVWGQGAVNAEHPAPERYMLCIQPVEVAWGSYNAGCHYVFSNSSRGRQVKFTPPDGVLPVYMEGKKLKWGVAACRQQRDLRGVPISNAWLCSNFDQAKRDMQWPLLPPVLVSPNGYARVVVKGDPSEYEYPEFTWRYPRRLGAEGEDSQKLCLYSPSGHVRDCEGGKAELVVNVPKGARRHILSVPDALLNKGFGWTVAVCSHALGCTWSQQVRGLTFLPRYADRNACVSDVPQAFAAVDLAGHYGKLEALTGREYEFVPRGQYRTPQKIPCGLSGGHDYEMCGYSHFQSVQRLRQGGYLALAGSSMYAYHYFYGLETLEHEIPKRTLSEKQIFLSWASLLPNFTFPDVPSMKSNTVIPLIKLNCGAAKAAVAAGRPINEGIRLCLEGIRKRSGLEPFMHGRYFDSGNLLRSLEQYVNSNFPQGKDMIEELKAAQWEIIVNYRHLLERQEGSHLFIVRMSPDMTKRLLGGTGTNVPKGKMINKVVLDYELMHPGGIQAIGDYLVIPTTTTYSLPFWPDDQTHRNQVFFVDVSEPTAPQKLHTLCPPKPETNDPCGQWEFGMAVAITRRPNGHYLLGVLASTENFKGIYWYWSKKNTLKDPQFTRTGIWAYPEFRCPSGTHPIICGGNPPVLEKAYSYRGVSGQQGFSGWGRYQNINFVRQCDGRLFMFGTYGVEDDFLGVDKSNARNYIDLFEVLNPDGASPDLKPVAHREATCHSYCNFFAGGTPYVTDFGQLHFYGTEHWPRNTASVPKGTIRLKEFSAR